MVADGQIVLMDCGCTVQGYQSDVSRTFVFGTASAEQRKVWGDVHSGQAIGFAAAQLGAPAGSVDDAVRRHYEALGYGPRYRLPGPRIATAVSPRSAVRSTARSPTARPMTRPTSQSKR